MAKAMGIGLRSVQRIGAEGELKPLLVAKFKVSNDPLFKEKVTDIVELYMSPPDKASTRRARFRRSAAPSWGR